MFGFGLSDIAAGVVKGFVSVLPGLATSIGNIIIASKQSDAAKEGKEDADGKELTINWLQSINDLNRAKLDHQTERQAIRAFIAFVIPTAFVWWTACLDSIPFYIPFFMLVPHHVGSWGVDIPPKMVDDFHMIVQSFFVAAPALAGVAMLGRVYRNVKGK